MKAIRNNKGKLLVGAVLVLILSLGLAFIVQAAPPPDPGPVTVTVQVNKSGGGGLAGVAVSYLDGYWKGIGTTNSGGTVTANLPSGTWKFKAEYGGTSAEQTQDIDSNSTVTFYTSEAKVVVDKHDGNPLSGVAVSYLAGYYRGIGNTDASGTASAQLFPGTYTFRAEYGGTSATQDAAVPGDGKTAGQTTTVTFNPTKVTLQYSGSKQYLAGYWRGFSSTIYLFPGTYTFKFDSYQKDITVSGCEAKKTVVVLKLKDHNGNPLAGGTARGGYGNSYSTWHVPGSTDANGVLLDIRDSLATTMSYEMRYNNTTQAKTQDVSVNSTFEFQTILLTLRLETCGGAPLDGGNPRYGVGSTYITWWFPGGVTGSSAPGETAAEFFPGTYSFEMQYKATADAKLSVSVPNTNTKLTWKTTKVTLNYVGQISYGGATGESTWFTKPSMELLPGTYKFYFRGDGRHDLTISGCEMGGNVVIISLHNEGMPLTDPQYYLECSGVGKLYNGLIFTDKTSFSCRARTGSIAGPWFSFNVANSLLTYEYATVHVTLFNGDKTLGDPHKVEVSGVGQFTTSQTFHVPTGTELSYRLRRNGIAGPWLKQKFDAGYTDWQLEFATLHVTLYNDSNKNGHIDDGETLGDPHKVEVSGVGQFTTSDTFHVPPDTELSYRLRRNGIAGPWLKQKFDAGYTDWQLEFATVHVTLFNGEEKLGDPHKVEVSGVGQFTTSETFHVPPGTDISYRLRRNGVAGPWQKRTFNAGYEDWQLEFATVHVTLFNGDVTLNDPHKVEVSGVGQFTTSQTFHVPPGTELSYRLRRNGIAGPWLKETFDAGYKDWKLEFATVTFKFDLPPDVAALMSTEISGYGTVAHGGVAHLPPGINISIRARSGGWATGWFSVGSLQAGEGTVIWGATPEYIPPAP